MMVIHGPMLPGVPTSLRSALIQLEKSTLFAQKYKNTLSHVHEDIKTILSLQYCEGDCYAVTSLVVIHTHSVSK